MVKCLQYKKQRQFSIITISILKTGSVTQNCNNAYQSKTVLNSVFTHTGKDKDFPKFLSLPLANDRTVH